ncbi:hypothetical protein GYMLUDRAFT_417086 [Collybiopsis luxurians FD-317 M1]|uniref:Unplaced genomic scaffold GYMLUscaffold_131, whole genome shotgun sequence n=1 Tax=Collybiopsis luxurians FD-317 M1 TaxID=944289 RepID=A0A0D0BN34_9AGAR|nr:hypothetical protein GYMLUDRAFT_417086 [Collybiopsis luxurians FD-317 M1]
MPSGETLHLVNGSTGLNVPSCFTTMVDLYDLCYPERHVVSEENGYRIIKPDESVLIFSGDPKKFCQENIDFIAIQNVARSPPQPRTANAKLQPATHSEMLYQYMEEVVDYACNVRRNVWV